MNTSTRFYLSIMYMCEPHHFGPKNAIAVVILRLILVARTSYQM